MNIRAILLGGLARKALRQRLEMFRGVLEPGEKALHVIQAYALCAWPLVTPGLPGFPTATVPTDALVAGALPFAPPQALSEDQALVDQQAAAFGYVMHALLSLLLVSDRRLIFIPIADKRRGSTGPGHRYPTYLAEALRHRWIPLAGLRSVAVEEVGYEFALAGAGKARMSVRAELTGTVGISGTKWPRFDISEFPETRAFTGERHMLAFMLSRFAAPNAWDLVVALDAAGVQVTPRPTDADRAAWIPAEDQLPR